MSLYKDQHYIDLAINGDLNAFATLMDRYKHMVYTLALRTVRNKEEAEEIAQDTFLKVYKGLKGFKGTSKFSTWVYKITYNKSLDYIKKRSKKLETYALDVNAEQFMGSVEDITERLGRQDRKVIIGQALLQLPEKDGFLITLHYYEELSLTEIASVMNESTNTIKVRLFRARNRLAKILSERLAPETIHSYGRK
ncbi:RNA polymerase sigma factor [Spongiimicrobium sp. 3-5]|uniref:RNA polymerase sigma factor n=1 Tax=Spongiimicrobium sp. 3-5 TaxID=3332596 RepID=UPI00397F17DF